MSSRRRRASPPSRSARSSGRGCTSFRFIGGPWDGQHEEYHLVHVPSFTPEPIHSWEQLNAEYVFELRWWALADLAVAEETFAPRPLPALARALIENGPPSAPLDAGD